MTDHQNIARRVLDRYTQFLAARFGSEDLFYIPVQDRHDSSWKMSEDTERALLSNLQATFQDLDAHWNPEDASASEAKFLALLESSRQLSLRDRSYVIELLAFVGRARSVQGRLKEAHVSLSEAEKVLEEHQATYRVSARIRWLLEKGRIHILEKTPSQARHLYREAWTLAVNMGEDSLAVEIAQQMAVIEPRKAQLPWIMKAIEIAEASPSPKAKRWLGGLYSTWAWKLHDLRQYEKALEVFQRALRHLKSHGTAREAFVAQWSIGRVLRSLGRVEEALSIQKALLSELGIGGARDGRLYEELAECLHALKRGAEAQLYFELAYNELSRDDWVSDQQPLDLKRLKDLGKPKQAARPASSDD